MEDENKEGKEVVEVLVLSEFVQELQNCMVVAYSYEDSIKKRRKGRRWS